MSENIRTTLTVPSELWEKIKAQAKADRRSNNAEVVWILEEYFKNQQSKSETKN